jgi:hypothetical protein
MGGDECGGGGRVVTHHDRGHEAAAGRGDGGALAGVGPPRPSSRAGGGARSESQSIRGRGVIEAPIGGDSVPRRGRSRRSSRQAPKPERGVLVVRSDGCVMS